MNFRHRPRNPRHSGAYLPKLNRATIREAKRAEKNYWLALNLHEYWQEHSEAAKELQLLQEEQFEQDCLELELHRYADEDEEYNYPVDEDYDDYSSVYDDDYDDYDPIDYRGLHATYLPRHKYGSFSVTQLLGNGERSYDVDNFNNQMAIFTNDGPILITKEQAMAFFDLEEKITRCGVHTRISRYLHSTVMEEFDDNVTLDDLVRSRFNR